MNKLLAELVPPGVVTTTLAVPALPVGVTQLAVVLLFTMSLKQATPPNVRVVAPVKLVPVMVMDVPPSVLPLLWEIEVTVGVANETVM